MKTDFVGAEHEFHSKEFALGWAERFIPTPERIRLFELIFSQLEESVPRDGNIIELGIGPGYLADFLPGLYLIETAGERGTLSGATAPGDSARKNQRQ